VKYRLESFGGIVASEEPPFLAFVDREFMRELGAGGSPLWRGTDESIGTLSAPTEVHMAVTNRCPLRCRHCYMGAGEPDPAELDTAGMKRALAALADMGVFHVALGGGEALARDDLFEIAAHSRELGLVPNLTVSGALMTPGIARRMKVFGQVNVSMDGVGEAYGVYRDGAGFAAADAALGMLVSAGVPAGINCVVGGTNFGLIGELFEYAARAGANEIEFLRLKPAGRGGEDYLRDRTDRRQNLELFPLLQRFSERHGVTAKVDCSFMPMVCEHRPPVDYLESTGTYGCVAGNVLLGARSDGSVAGCSFLPPLGLDVFGLAGAWADDPELERLRNWPGRAPEPCRSCEYLEVCRGGCRAVAAFSGDPGDPDPDCPRVVRWREERS